MPQLEVTTKEARQVWASPDGQRVIYELTMDYNGQPVKAKTYSKEVSREGWSGTVETYEKPGRNGPETFVKQPQKEGGGYGGGGGSRAPRDDSAIKAQMAIKAAVQALPEAKSSNLTEYLSDVEALAQGLYEMIDRVKATPVESAPKEDTVHEVTADDPIDLSKIDEMFPDNEKVGG